MWTKSTIGFVIVLLLGAIPLNAQTPDAWHVSLDTAGGGGFTGLQQVTVQSIPNTTCDASSPPKCTIDPNNVVIIKNASYTWQPTLSVGLIFRFIPPRAWQDQDGDGIGFGVGGQFVFLPASTGSTAAPAATFNIGTQGKQLFFGAIFTKSNTADIPGGGSRAVVPIGFPTDGFIRLNSGRSPVFFAGIIIAGKSITGPPPNPTAPRR